MRQRKEHTLPAIRPLCLQPSRRGGNGPAADPGAPLPKTHQKVLVVADF